MKSHHPVRVLLGLGLGLGAGVVLVAWSPERQLTSVPGQALSRLGSAGRGETTTRLPDGRLLVLGGEDASGSTMASAFLADPRSGHLVALGHRLRRARAWHTATVLPDGSVLVLGGIGPSGRVVRRAERFLPASQTFAAVGAPLTPRAGHTAALLTDGHLLVAGGVSADGRPLSTAELWDPAERAAPVAVGPLGAARFGARAVLQMDGRVLLWGGSDESGAELARGELFDPDSREFTPVDSFPAPAAPPARLEASAPLDGAADVALDRPLALRFSLPLAVETANTGTFRLSALDGAVPLKVVPAEDGRLVFVTPDTSLRPATTYTLTFEGLADEGQQVVPPGAIRFTTRAAPPAPPAAVSRVHRSIAPGGSGSGVSGTPEELSPPSDQTAAIRTRRRKPRRSLPPLEAAPGVTALAGQVLRRNGQPLPGVTLQIDEHRTETDDTGRFLLTDLTCEHCVMAVDGRAVSGHGRTYGVFDFGVDVVAGETNALPYVIWMLTLDTAHALTVPSPTPTEVVLTTPRIPGLEVHLPAGTVIRDRDGQVVHRVTITPIPKDRPIMPVPPWLEVPLVFTLQPGGSHLETPSGSGAWIVYPNADHLPPRRRVKYMTYDPPDKEWFVYGLGRVTDDGRRIVPGPGVTFDTFRCSLQNAGDVPPEEAPSCVAEDPMCFDPTAGTTGVSGDPVDLSTGLFALRKTDLVLNDVIPISVTRVYQTEDPVFYHFGTGMQHTYNLYLFSAHQFTEAELILPEGGRIHYVRISSGDGFRDAIFENQDSSTAFQKSRIAWNGRGWDLALRDGTTYVFGVNAHLLAIRDRNGNQVTITRELGSFGPITRVTSPSGRFIDFTYNTAPNPVIVKVTDNIGRTVTYGYDTGGHLKTVTGPDPAYLITYAYGQASPATSVSRMTQIDDARQFTFLRNTFDLASGRVLIQKQADDTTYQFSYALSATTVTDPRQIRRRVTFDAKGRVLTDTRALGLPEEQTITLTRDPTSGLVRTRTDALGRVTQFDYDALGNITAVTRLAGTAQAVTTSFTYDPFGLAHTRTDPLGHTTTYAHDGQGNLVGVIDPLQHETSITYNDMGLPTAVTDPVHNTTQFFYDRGDLVAVVDRLGNTEERLVDGAGRVVKVVDALGRVTAFDSDVMNRLVRKTDALGGTVAYAYDANGNLLQSTDARQNTTQFVIGKMERLSKRTDPLLRAELFTYDGNGNVAQITDRKGQKTTFSYDSLNRRIFAGFKTLAGSPPTYEGTITYTYDQGDRLRSATDVTFGGSDFGTLTRQYDDLDRLVSEVTPAGQVGYTYDAAGRRVTMSASFALPVTYTYDVANRLTQITQGTRVVSFGYDAAGRRTSLTLPNGVVTTYGYDAASRVTSLTYTHGATLLGDLTYTYDAAGNRVTQGGSFARTGLPAAVSSAVYDAANELTQWNATVLTYDANGSLTNDGTNAYGWNARNQLTTLNPIGLGSTLTFLYDPFGRRTSLSNGSSGAGYFYDGLNPVVGLTGLGLDEYLALDTTSPFFPTVYPLADALGSTVALTDTTGTVITPYTYEPFGNTTSSGAVVGNPFQYTGRENDGRGLYYFRARYYHPVFQRFISEDPLNFPTLPGAANLYAYTSDNPLRFIDPSGLCFEEGEGMGGAECGAVLDICRDFPDLSYCQELFKEGALTEGDGKNEAAPPAVEGGQLGGRKN